MKSFSPMKGGKIHPVLFICIFFFQFNLMADIDLELTMTVSEINPTQYSHISLETVVTNNGNETATEVVVEVPISNLSQIVYSGGNEFTLTQGVFYPYGTEIWEVGNLAPGESATLTTNYFVLEETQYVIFSQVLNAGESDSDSTPNNGTPPTPNEDDEAVLIFNDSGTICDISFQGIDAVCDDNGTPNITNDDQWFAHINPTGTGLGATFSISGNITANNLPYGQNHIFGPYPVDPFLHIGFEITDDDFGCSSSFILVNGSSCSTRNQCQISGEVVSTGCSVEGTPNDPIDDTWDYIINVTGTNTSNNWVWEFPGGGGFFTGIYDQPASFTNLPLTGPETVTIDIHDQADVNCTTTITVEAPFPCTPGGDLADVELSMNSTSVAGAFVFVSFDITATNAGTADANDLNIFVPIPDDVVLQGGNEFSATAGNVFGFSNVNWNLPTLAPGQTETLTVNYFTFTDANVTCYAEVSSMIGDDVDSTPANGTPPIPNEDDEAAFTLGGVPNLPDLTVSNLSHNLPATLEIETDYPIAFDLNNIGTTLAAGDFRIGMYLSLDETFDENTDILVGQVLTGNIANTTPINALINVENTTPSQDYFLLIVADDLKNIVESDENNNVLSAGNSFTVFNINDVCTGLFLATSQAELDQFPQSCTTWAGSIELNGDITDLSPLSNLEIILGNLIFEECTVTDFSPLAGLKEAGTLFFYFNPDMSDLNGLPANIETRSIQVIGNPNLTNLDGMPIVTTELDNLTIANNAFLSDFNGLSGISGNHPDMVLVVDLNPQLASLSGLENITQVNTISIASNENLTDCCPIFELLNSNAFNSSNIQDNESGCNSVADILGSCDNPGTGCAFENTYPPHPAVVNQKRQRAVETTDGIEIETFGSAGGGQFIYYDLSVDLAGDEISNTNTLLPTDIFRRTNDGNFISYDNPTGTELRVIKSDGSGGIIWENTFDFSFGPGQSPPLIQDMIETADGFAFIALVHSGGVNLHLLKIDQNGNEVVKNNFLTLNNFTFINIEEEAENGDFFAFYQGSGSNLVRIGSDGTLVYDKSVGSPDFPSYDIGDFAESVGGQFLYLTSINFDLMTGPRLVKLDAFTGDPVSGITINDVLSPSSNWGGFLPRKILPTSDGGAVLGYEISESGMLLGWEIGEIDSDGNQVWVNQILGDYDLEPVLETADGGFLFAGEINDEFGLIKTTSLGELTPICAPLGCVITVTVLDTQCQNQSTLDDDSDDTFSARILVEGTSNCQGNFLIDGQFGGLFGGQGIFGEQATLGYYPISDGNASVEVTDVNGDNGVLVTLEAPDACSNGEDPDECGFENTYPPIPEFLNLISQKAVETADGYDLEMFGNAVGAPLFVYYDLSVDFEGTELSNSSTILPLNGFKRVESGNFYAMENVSNTEMRLRMVDNSGATVWENIFTFDTGNPQGIPVAKDVIEVSDGIVFLVMTNGPTDNSWLLKTDFAGNLIYNEHFQEENGFIQYRFEGLAQNGDLLIYRQSSSRTGFLIRATPDADLIYQEAIIGDLVTSRMGGFAETPDGNFIYASYRNQLTPELKKLNAFTGETVWKINLSNTFSPENDMINSGEGDVVATADGGAVLGYPFFPTFGGGDPGYEYGKINPNGLLVWWQHLPEGYDLDAELETSDGGFLFAGDINGVFGVVKTTSEGFLTPPCDIVSPLGIDLELSMTVSNPNPAPFSFFSATLELENNGTKDGTGIIVDFPLPKFLTYQGGNEYSASHGTFSPYGNNQWNVGNLNVGESATLTVNYFVLTDNKPLEIYAQVIAQDPIDRDSEPNNGTPPTVNEDDEAAVLINVGSQNAFGLGQSFSFHAHAAGDFVTELIWTHDLGKEVKNYVPERSLDGVNFETLSIRNSVGQNGFELYEDYDSDAVTGDNFYRIRMEMTDGSTEFSEIEIVHFADLIDFTLFPNPANKFVKVNLETIVGFENVEIEIYNNLGVKVFEKKIEKVFSPYNQLNLRDLHEGFYMVYLKIPNRRPMAKRLMVGRI